MQKQVNDGMYPLSFRSADVKYFDQHIARHHSMQLVGMKRVGINNLIRHFFAHSNYPANQRYLFVLVDLNNLVEREIFPFWQLTLKRIFDAVRDSQLPITIEKKVTRIFEHCIQYENLLMTYDGVRESLQAIVGSGIYPVIFFTRFDRISNLLSEDFFDNLNGIHAAVNNQMSYVFTSYRELQELAPTALKNKSVLEYLTTHYIKPAGHEDSRSIIESFDKQHNIELPNKIVEGLIDASGGHTQYLQFALTRCTHRECRIDNLVEDLYRDERILLLGEELWDSLNTQEQSVLRKAAGGETVTDEDQAQASYLWNTGMVHMTDNALRIFSPLLTQYIQSKTSDKKSDSIELTKKEHLLFTCLQSHLGEICERETIIEHVWPEDEDYGISDWSIDKLVERLRVKLAKKHQEYEIVTIRTRGYKMAKISN